MIFLLDPNYEPADKPAKKLKSETKILVTFIFCYFITIFYFLCVPFIIQ